MKLPFSEYLAVSESKLAGYLLSEKHPIGRTKAVLFKRFGYSAEAWSIFARDLIRIARENEVTSVEKTPFGVRYVIDGVLSTPSGRPLPVRTIWFVDNDEQIAHFVTAYPR